MNTKSLTTAFALALALGVAAPAFADDPGGDPGLSVEKLTFELQSNSVQSSNDVITTDSSSRS